jgi:hypothetical protein
LGQRGHQPCQKRLDDARTKAVEELRQARYFIKQADWLQERFPDAELRDVEGLVKRVDHGTIEAHNWSLTCSLNQRCIHFSTTELTDGYTHL